MDKAQIVREVRERHSDLTSIDKFIPFLLDVCRTLNDGSGLLRKDGGEDIVLYEPAGTMVSIKRICYPDGTIAKVLAAAGANANPDTLNAPIYNYPEDTLDSSFYVPIVQTPEDGGGVTEPDLAPATIRALQVAIGTINANSDANTKIVMDKINAIEGHVNEAIDKLGGLGGLFGGRA